MFGTVNASSRFPLSYAFALPLFPLHYLSEGKDLVFVYIIVFSHVANLDSATIN